MIVDVVVEVVIGVWVSSLLRDSEGFSATGGLSLTTGLPKNP